MFKVKVYSNIGNYKPKHKKVFHAPQIKNSLHVDFLVVIKVPIYPQKFRDQFKKNFSSSHDKFSNTNYNRYSKKIATNNGKETKINSKKTTELHILIVREKPKTVGQDIKALVHID